MFDSTKVKDSDGDKWYAIDNYLTLLARIFISALFIWSGTNKIMHPVATQENMSAHGMPFTLVFLVAAIALEILGGLSVLLGIKTRWGAGMLIVFLIPATLIFHTNLGTEIEQAMFLKNLGILGGLLMLIHYGGGSIVLFTDDKRSHQDLVKPNDSH